jgi:hypothetical protein
VPAFYYKMTTKSKHKFRPIAGLTIENVKFHEASDVKVCHGHRSNSTCRSLNFIILTGKRLRAPYPGPIKRLLGREHGEIVRLK